MAILLGQYPGHMTYDETIQFFRTQVKIAAALGITQPTVSAWGGVIPDAYQYQIEVITGGALEVDPHLRRPRNITAQQATDSLRGSKQA